MKLILALSGAFLVAACSSVPTQTVASTDTRVVCDKEQMARVHAQAVATGASVYWIRCPEVNQRAKT
jgi:starvation-inducible outer membrane lipoprotein